MAERPTFEGRLVAERPSSEGRLVAERPSADPSAHGWRGAATPVRRSSRRHLARLGLMSAAALALAACSYNGQVPLGDQARQAKAGYLIGGDVTGPSSGAASIGSALGSAGEAAPGTSPSNGGSGTPNQGHGAGSPARGTSDFCAAYRDLSTETAQLIQITTSNLRQAKQVVAQLDADARQMAASAPAGIKARASQLAQAVDTLNSMVQSSKSQSEVQRKANATQVVRQFISSAIAVSSYGERHC